MSVLSRLQSIGIELCPELPQIECSILRPLSGASAAMPPTPMTQENVLSRLQSSSVKLRAELSQLEPSTVHAGVMPPNPMVSCLMITRGNIEMMMYSLACYRRQTYPNRELVLVTKPEVGEKVRAFIATQETSDVAVLVAPLGLTLGDRRNLAVRHARGAILVTWDDDDLSDPKRIVTAVQVLCQTGAAAVFLSRLLVWWPERRVAAISRRRLWEQSIAAWRSYMPRYASLPRGEDSVAINRFIDTHIVAQVDCPLLYVYAITGENISTVAHFEAILSTAECIFEGDQFDELNNHLSGRLPVADYAALLRKGRVRR
jgi:glycosyltransferase involved in cell wall biosynthesis